MYIIAMYIDSQSDLDQYKREVVGKLIYVIPLLHNNRDHLTKNTILSFYVQCDQKEYILPFKHPESIFDNYTIEDVINNTKCYFHNKQILNYQKVLTSNVYDLELVHYLNTVTPLETDNIDTEYFYHRLHIKYNKSNTLISLANFVKYSRAILAQSNLTREEGLVYYDKMQSLLHQVESNGIQVDKKYFTALYGAPINLINDRVYTKYNFFTTTGRPSNRFGGINFAALNKQDDTRRCFVSRYDEGTLVELDFKAYHPHIIAYLCDYDFGNQDVYEHLAHYYFDTTTPTKDQIKQAKELTFNQMYGGINRKYLNIPYFAKAKEFTTTLYKTYKEQGYIESAISGRHFHVVDDEDLTDAKLFNYFIQMTETELNGLFLEKLLPAINSQLAVPVLYIYDAVVFDCKKEYINVIIQEIIGATSTKFPVTVKVGDNYKEMTLYEYETPTTVHIYN